MTKLRAVAPVASPASDEAAFMCGSLVEITGAQAVAQANRASKK